MSRILFLCPYTPQPITDGAKLRIYNVAKILAKRHSVDLLITEEEEPSKQALSKLKSEFNEVEVFQHNNWEFYKNIAKSIVSKRPAYSHYHMFNDVRRYIDRKPVYDLYFCSYVHMAEYIRQRDEPKIVDLVDSMSRNYLTRVQRNGPLFNFKDTFRYIEGKKLQRYEQNLISEFDQSFVISPADKQFICPKRRCDLSVVPNGVKAKYLQYKNSEDTANNKEKRIIFFGKMNYFPNEDAVSYFVQKILPQISSDFPNVQFQIAGMDPSKRVQELERSQNVNVIGFVDDPAEHITDADVVAAPMRFGTGVQNKILEAMALGQPVVTTPLGQEGIISEDGEHLLVAEGAEAFAETTKKLLQNPDEQRRIGENARQLIKKKYTWSAVESVVNQKVQEVLQKG